MADEPTISDPTRDIPSAESVRSRLAHTVREAAVLRRLLKLAEFAKRYLPNGNDQKATDEEAAQ